MFTGITEEVGILRKRVNLGNGVAFTLEAKKGLSDPKEGESIAINGICLTARDISGNYFIVDVSPETLARSTLGHLQVGARVNLEKALRLTDRLGGHIVSGHVDCIAKVSRIEALGEFTLFTFVLQEKLGRYIIEKGSVAIDGISLTINHCDGEAFGVSVIPHTLKNTTLGDLRVGTDVNIEVDIIGKYVEKLLQCRDGGQTVGVSLTFLAENGFL